MNPSPQHSPYFQNNGENPQSNIHKQLDPFSTCLIQGNGAIVSTTFGPDDRADGAPPDLTIFTSDHVLFYVHRHRLLLVSANAFSFLLVQPSPSITVLEHSAILNVVLHTIYGLPCTHHGPSLDTLSSALVALTKYGVPIQAYATPSQPLYPLLLAHAPYHPIETYALAGQHGLEDAAVAISAHLLAYDVSRLSDELAVKMGPVYFRRFVDLHQMRVRALKHIVLRPPEAHPPTATCGEDAQGQGQKLMQAWAFAVAQLAWDTLPGISTHALQSMFERAGANIACEDCRTMLQFRIQEVTQQWSAVKGFRLNCMCCAL